MDHLIKENGKIINHINFLSDSVALIQKFEDIKDHPLFQKLLEELRLEDEDCYRNFVRMSADDLEYLLQKVEPLIEKRDTNMTQAISATTRLAITLRYLATGVTEADNQIKITNMLLRRDLANVRKDFDTEMRKLRTIQADILKFLVKTKKRQIAKAECLITPLQKAKSLLPSSQSILPRTLQQQMINSTLKQIQLKFEDLAVTPKISINDYKASPLVKSSKRMIPFDLLEFDVRITQKRFDSIPKYMRGRVNCDELQNFLEHIIVPCFNEKYKLIHRPRSVIQNTKEFELWKVFHSQITYAPGRNFITVGDIARKMERMIDKKTQNLLIMIRHIGILQEQRISQTICYIWTATS